MKVAKESVMDSLAYALACIATLGLAWVLRSIITIAIKYAFKNEMEIVDAEK